MLSAKYQQVFQKKSLTYFLRDWITDVVLRVAAQHHAAMTTAVRHACMS